MSPVKKVAGRGRRNLQYSAVWGTRGAVGAAFVAVADDVIVPKISSMLEATGRDEREPSVLAQNSGIAFKGMEMYGLGFVVDADVATAWISTDSRYGDVVKPFLNGDDLNASPLRAASRWAVNFQERDEREAASFPLAFDWIQNQVKSERAGKALDVRTAPWWLYWRSRPALVEAIKGLPDVLAMTRHSATAMPLRVASGPDIQ